MLLSSGRLGGASQARSARSRATRVHHGAAGVTPVRPGTQDASVHARQGHLDLQWQGAPGWRLNKHVCRATVEDPQLADLVRKMEAMRPTPPEERDLLVKAINAIDEANSKDPRMVEWQGRKYPYHLLYSHWLTEWVEKLDAKASDELIILARGRNMESWRLSEIRREDYAPNAAGARQHQGDRKRAQAARLVQVMRDAGYGEMSVKLVEEVMLERGVPDPRDIRKHDLIAPLGTVNYRLLEQACMIQTLRDAEGMVFMEKNFIPMFEQLPADELLPILARQLAAISDKCGAMILDMDWTPVQRKLVSKAVPTPISRFSTIFKAVEGVAAGSSHPGDWRYKDFDYE